MKKTTKSPQQHSSIRMMHGLASGSFIAALAVMLAPSTQAGNVLQNPGFESQLANWSVVSSVSWNIQPGSAQGKLYHTGVNSMWTQGIYTGGANISYAYQTVACAAGSTFTASAAFSQYVNHDGTVGEGGDNGTSGLFGTDGDGQENAWVEVLFMDANNVVLSDYRSKVIDPAYETDLINAGATTAVGAQTILNWIACDVTNQLDPSQILNNADPDTYPAAITNHVAAGQYMVAPPGTAKVQYRLSLFQAKYESGASYWDDAVLNLVGGPAPSVVSNVTPDGTKFFNDVSGGFSFDIASASSGGATLPDNPQSGVQVLVNGVDRSSQLQFTGNTKNWHVVLPTLTSNSLYSIGITVSNTAGLKTVNNVVFDTFSTNPFVLYVEDYDFNNGQFIQDPVPTNAAAANSYWGTAGVPGVDINYSGGGTTLAPNYPNRTDGAVDFQSASDLEMPFYAAQGNSSIYSVNISYNNGGNWQNYTRNPYPQGNYVAYARMSGGGGYGVEYLNILTSGYGTSTQTTNNIGQFVIANGTSWTTYSWVPLTDTAGNLKVFSIPSGQQTLQLLSGGNNNLIDVVFLPATSVGFPPVISNLSPALGTQTMFLGGNTNVTFNVTSPSGTIASSNIVITLNGAPVAASITGGGASWAVSAPIPQNQVLTMLISITDNAGLNKAVTYSFDTFSQTNFVFEAEDYDFAGGQFIDNPRPAAAPAPDSYLYTPAGDSGNLAITNIDYTPTFDTGVAYIYRPSDFAGTQTTTDFLRQKFIDNGSSDYNLGWWDAGEWYNYTRTYPTGTFAVYGRLAGGSPFSGVKLSLVTSGRGTTNQTTQLLGTFADPNASGWQTWHWVPMLNAGGQLATISLGGVETLRATGGTGQNANFFMLVPMAAPMKLNASVTQGKIQIQIPTQTGFNYTVLYNNSLTSGTWQPLGSSFAGTGATVTVSNSIPAVAGQQFYKVVAQ